MKGMCLTIPVFLICVCFACSCRSEPVCSRIPQNMKTDDILSFSVLQPISEFPCARRNEYREA